MNTTVSNPNELDALDMFAEELTSDPLTAEELPSTSLLGCWGSASCFGSASCPASTASTAGSASCG